MKTVNIHHAKTHLSELLKEVANGDEITIARAGEPIALLVAFPRKNRKRLLGLDIGKFEVSDDFDERSTEIEALFNS
jgi:prevent-host-death family protein